MNIYAPATTTQRYTFYDNLLPSTYFNLIVAGNHSNHIQFILQEWTDHALLSVNLKFDNPDHDFGIWRANPSLTKNTYFIEQLHKTLDKFHSQLTQISSPPDAQSIWDNIKELIKTLARSISRFNGEWRQRQLKRLQKKRNRILRSGHIQQEIVNTLALRSGIRWRENGEKAAGVLKRIIKQQTTTQSTLPTIIHPSHWQQL
ncbi:hypothetical protein INT46_000970 [Mucor plumbeus]|uniref:Uncharacterized protein n=1 Tax=Mucor plumbeus TaxID=97098 RepID=A0A8H7RFB9_9FUNG|nr:hypothetical protein INT46_000970 [Mucor plumbeus]